VRDQSPTTPGFYYILEIRVPALSNYSHAILWVQHDIELYPAILKANKPAINVSCADEAEFETAVGSVLSSPEITTLLSRLKSQITPA
jgi:hypothetical protein